MTAHQRTQWARLARTIRTASATAEALACGFKDNHGGSLGDPVRAADQLTAKLATAAALARELTAQRH